MRKDCKCFSLLYGLSILEKILNVFSFFSLNIANFELLMFNRNIERVNSNPRIPFVTQDSLFVNENPVL